MLEDFVVTIYPGELVDDEVTPELAGEVRDALSDLQVPSDELRIESGSAGYGAEGVTIMAIVAAIFFSGKKIDENLDAWIRVGGRLRGAIRRLNERFHGVSLSEPAALALAADALSKQAGFGGDAHLLSSTRLPVSNGSLSHGYVNDFRYQPDRFYVFIVRDGKQDTYVVCIRSNAETEFVHRLPTGDWLEYHGIEH